MVQTYSTEEQVSDVKPRVYVPTLILEEKILELGNKLKDLQSENEQLKLQLSESNIVSTIISDDSKNVGSETHSDNSSTTAFMGITNENVSTPTGLKPRKDSYSDVQYVYDFEGESNFEGDVKKRDRKSTRLNSSHAD